VPTTFFLAKEFNQAILLSPLVGFFAAGIFTGFAVYLPELFPTAIRATAQGFCYNFARFFSAAAPFVAGALIFAHGAFAPAITTISCIYFFGLIVLLFARETQGQALPE
jgi:MFS family permease